jgi:hypothetical protein
MDGLRKMISKMNLKGLKHGTFGRECLPKVIGLALGKYRTMVVKSETIYATMQPPVPPAASTGADGAGSASGVLEVMVKRSTKKSIGVIVWCVV